MDRRFALGVVLRIALLIAGITWSLAMFVEWAETPPLAAGAGLWYHWIVEHQLLSLTAVAAGMFPRETAAWIRKTFAGRTGWITRAALLAGGITWGLWVPPALAAAGLGGLVNEILGVTGAPAAWGAIAPDVGLGAALIFHWIFQHAVLATFALGLAFRPSWVMDPLLRTVEGAPTEGTATRVAA